MRIRYRWVIVAATFALTAAAVPLGSASTATAASSVSTISANGSWPGVGTVCEKGAGGSATGRGLSNKSVDIATFADPGNTVTPGLNREFFQVASAFAKWCNAAGGINGRSIVVHDRDGALFNAAQVTATACQQDFMSVGGGLVLDQPSVPVRVGCGLGQIPAYLVSDAADTAALQVDPLNTSLNETEAGWYGAMAKRYPQAVKHAGIGAPNTASILEPTEKWEQAAKLQGWNFVDFEEPPLSTPDWTPYIQKTQSAGVQALEPPTAAGAPYFQAMVTAGYKPAFILLNEGSLLDSAPGAPSPLASSEQFNATNVAPTFVPIQEWPFQLASQSPGLEQLIALMHTYAKGEPIDTSDEFGIDAWLLFAKAASACGANLTTTCVLQNAAAQKNWTGGGVYVPLAHLALSNENPTPSDCYAIVQITGTTKYVYDKKDTKPNNQIWHCDPKTIFQVHVNS